MPSAGRPAITVGVGTASAIAGAICASQRLTVPIFAVPIFLPPTFVARQRETQTWSRSGSTTKKRTLGKRIGKVVGQITEAIENGFKSVAGGVGSIFGLISSILFPQVLRKKLDSGNITKSKKAKKT